MTRVRKIEVVVLSLLAACSYATRHANAQSPQGIQAKRPAQAKPQEKSEVEADEGEKRFQAHCQRCHNAPEDLSPRTVRAVVRQMRVRAMLTEEDERLIVKFIAP